MLPGTSLKESRLESTCGNACRKVSTDSLYNDEGAASPMAETPSASVSSTMTVRWTPDAFPLAIFHTFASFSSCTRLLILIGKFNQIFDCEETTKLQRTMG